MCSISAVNFLLGADCQISMKLCAILRLARKEKSPVICDASNCICSGELVDWSIASPEQMQLLASHITGDFSLRANRNMAQSFIEIWQSAPSRKLTAEMLHIAALSY